MSNSRLSSALLAQIAEVTIERGRNDLFVAEVPATMPVLGEAHIETLQMPENERSGDAGALGRYVEVSQMVDAIQTGDGTYVSHLDARSLGFLSEVFQKIISDVKFRSSPLDEDDSAQYRRARGILYTDPNLRLKADEYEKFCELRADLAKKNVALLKLRSQIDGTHEPAVRVALQDEIDDLSQQVNAQREEVDALDDSFDFRWAEGIEEKAERAIDRIPDHVRSALETLPVLAQLTDPATLSSHVACSFFPAELSEDSWIPLTLSPADLTGDLKYGGADLVIGGDEVIVEAVSLDAQTLVVERPWFWPGLFDNDRWEWRQAGHSPISVGRPAEAGEALIPAYVYALVFARNLTVAGHLRTPGPPSQGDVSDPAASLLAKALQAEPQAVGEPRVPILKRRKHFPVRGQVVDERTNQPIRRAVVTATDDPRNRATTNFRGRFNLRGLAKGKHQLTIERTGFGSTAITVDLPARPVSIGLRAEGNCDVEAALFQREGSSSPRPFEGQAQLILDLVSGRRIEAVDGVSRVSLRVPAGPATIAVAAPFAESVHPQSVGFEARADELISISFEMVTSPTWHNPNIQLLGIVCRKVPLSPRRGTE